MNVSKKPQVLFYQKLGELFYAVAAADKIVQKSEYEALRKMVISDWKDLDDYEDVFHTDAAFQIEIVFDWFDYEHLDADDCFNNFKEYKKEHEHLFTEERKKLILRTADAIANAFSGKNKSELIMLARLKILLDE